MSTNRALRIPDYLYHIVQAIGRIKNYILYTHDMTYDISCVAARGAPHPYRFFAESIVHDYVDTLGDLAQQDRRNRAVSAHFS